jgi:hypothetical protein
VLGLVFTDWNVSRSIDEGWNGRENEAREMVNQPSSDWETGDGHETNDQKDTLAHHLATQSRMQEMIENDLLHPRVGWSEASVSSRVDLRSSSWAGATIEKLAHL